MKPRIYISGPISGHDIEERRKAFKEVQKEFEDDGWTVFNQMENGLPPESTTHEHMRRDLSVLTNEEIPFEAIFMMKRWTHSAGCWKEFETAISCGIRVIFEEMNLKKGIKVERTLEDEYCTIKFE